jgi:hypothetical protein
MRRSLNILQSVSMSFDQIDEVTICLLEIYYSWGGGGGGGGAVGENCCYFPLVCFKGECLCLHWSAATERNRTSCKVCSFVLFFVFCCVFFVESMFLLELVGCSILLWMNRSRRFKNYQVRDAHASRLKRTRNNGNISQSLEAWRCKIF